ncbi:MAG: hypothetical protein APF81_03650 [Desulfosporosinus sp. BRH_c37]|nr:MAG: hypothetical protein APF81_03650 [Desulfosporosinus sp. BRH_c37]
MRTPSETLDFVTKLLINDLNMLTVELSFGTSRTLDNTNIHFPVIEITFKDISKSNWLNVLNTELQDFLQGQKFLVTNCDENTMIIALF